MKAVIEIGIIMTGEIDGKTLKIINTEIREVLSRNGIIMNGLLVVY